EAIGNEMRTWVNDVPVSAVIDTIDNSGFIGLQVHSIPDSLDGLKVYFKNIKIQTENLIPKDFPQDFYWVNLASNQLSEQEEKAGYQLLFNGQNSDGWRSEERRVGKECRSRWRAERGRSSERQPSAGLYGTHR